MFGPSFPADPRWFLAGAASDSRSWEPRQLEMGAPMAHISIGMFGGMPGQQQQVMMPQANQQLSQPNEMKQAVQSNHLGKQWLNYQANQVKHLGIQPSWVQNSATQLSQQSPGIAGAAQGYQPTSQARWSPAVPFAPSMPQPLHGFPSKDDSRQDFDPLNWKSWCVNFTQTQGQGQGFK